MKIVEILSNEGSLNHIQFRMIEIVTTTLMVITPFLLFFSMYLLIIVIPLEALLYYIWTVSTIKRLRGVGRPDSDFIKILIPFVSWKIEKELRGDSGFGKNGELTEEGYKEILRDYQIQEYERARRSHKRTDDY